MKKRILLAMVILSTSLLAASGTITGTSDKAAISGEGMTESINLTLTGKAVKPVTLSSNEVTTVEFGTVLLGRTSTAIVPLTVGGESGFNVSLAAEITGNASNVTITGLSKITLEDVDSTVNMTLAYKPTTAGEILNETLTVTATYAD
ncbi:MAG: hypothetical protein ACRDAG_02815 [Cetobacterium somerae]|uniref:hypothetical protein n=1 Tax=Cetobacterium somerae TaxID=188913 RepID=UPI003F2BB849